MTQTTQDVPASANILLTLLVALLTPMFLTASGGDIDCARMAALETITAYRAENQASLIAVALIVAFALATIGSLSLSLNDDISPAMAMRLRGNANALNRSTEVNRRALADLQAGGTTQALTMTADDHAKEEAAIAALTAARQALAETRTQPPIPEAAQPEPQPPMPAPIQTQSPAPDLAAPKPAISASREPQNRAAWATAITEVAGEFTASLPYLPPAERKLTTRKIAAMTSSVTALLSNDPLPRLEPGSLGALIQSHAKKPAKYAARR